MDQDPKILQEFPVFKKYKHSKHNSILSQESKIIQIISLSREHREQQIEFRDRSLQLKDFWDEQSSSDNKTLNEGMKKNDDMDLIIELRNRKELETRAMERKNTEVLNNGLADSPTQISGKVNTRKVVPLSHDEHVTSDQSLNPIQMINRKSVYQRWKKLGIVFLSIHRMQHHSAIQIDTPQKFLQDMNNDRSCRPSSSKANRINIGEFKANTNVFNDFISEMRKAELFVILAERGSENDLEKMHQLYMNDPKRFCRSSKDLEHLLNKRNKYGQNAMYMAAKNGNLKILQFLVKHEGDPHISSKVNDGIEESPLEVAIRWSHKDCVEWMINNIQYDQQTLRKAIRISWNYDIKQSIEQKLDKKCSSFFSCF